MPDKQFYSPVLWSAQFWMGERRRRGGSSARRESKSNRTRKAVFTTTLTESKGGRFDGQGKVHSSHKTGCTIVHSAKSEIAFGCVDRMAHGLVHLVGTATSHMHTLTKPLLGFGTQLFTLTETGGMAIRGYGLSLSRDFETFYPEYRDKNRGVESCHWSDRRSPRFMSIIELLQKVGPENVKVQYLNECITNVSASKKGSKVTFVTCEYGPNDLVSENGKIGMIVWIPKDKWPK